MAEQAWSSNSATKRLSHTIDNSALLERQILITLASIASFHSILTSHTIPARSLTTYKTSALLFQTSCIEYLSLLLIKHALLFQTLCIKYLSLLLTNHTLCIKYLSLLLIKHVLLFHTSCIEYLSVLLTNHALLFSHIVYKVPLRTAHQTRAVVSNIVYKIPAVGFLRLVLLVERLGEEVRPPL